MQVTIYLACVSQFRDCAIITWRGEGGWEIRGGGGIGENDNKRKGRLDVKFNTYRRGGGITFSLLFSN